MSNKMKIIIAVAAVTIIAAMVLVNLRKSRGEVIETRRQGGGKSETCSAYGRKTGRHARRGTKE